MTFSCILYNTSMHKYAECFCISAMHIVSGILVLLIRWYASMETFLHFHNFRWLGKNGMNCLLFFSLKDIKSCSAVCVYVISWAVRSTFFFPFLKSNIIHLIENSSKIVISRLNYYQSFFKGNHLGITYELFSVHVNFSLLHS